MRNYRNELKFITNPNQAQILKQRLALLMGFDDNANNEDNTYFIRSLYFDDLYSTAFNEKIDGVLNRRKYRIRIYNFKDNFIRLECKYKNNMMTSKDQCKISRELCEKIIANDIDGIDAGNNKLLRNFLVEMKTKHLVPSTIVDYRRTAFVYDVSRVRITFDEHLKSGMYSSDLFNENIATFDIFDSTKTVIEVKFDYILPPHIARVLQTIPMYRQAVSKFAVCRNIK